jgi:hypothetical protein
MEMVYPSPCRRCNENGIRHRQDSVAIKNSEMSALICRVTHTIQIVKTKERMGTLFQELCEMMDENVARVISFQSHRFLGL